MTPDSPDFSMCNKEDAKYWLNNDNDSDSQIIDKD